MVVNRKDGKGANKIEQHASNTCIPCSKPYRFPAQTTRKHPKTLSFFLHLIVLPGFVIVQHNVRDSYIPQAQEYCQYLRCSWLLLGPFVPKVADFPGFSCPPFSGSLASSRLAGSRMPRGAAPTSKSHPVSNMGLVCSAHYESTSTLVKGLKSLLVTLDCSGPPQVSRYAMWEPTSDHLPTCSAAAIVL